MLNSCSPAGASAGGLRCTLPQVADIRVPGFGFLPARHAQFRCGGVAHGGQGRGAGALGALGGPDQRGDGLTADLIGVRVVRDGIQRVEVVPGDHVGDFLSIAGESLAEVSRPPSDAGSCGHGGTRCRRRPGAASAARTHSCPVAGTAGRRIRTAPHGAPGRPGPRGRRARPGRTRQSAPRRGRWCPAPRRRPPAAALPDQGIGEAGSTCRLSRDSQLPRRRSAGIHPRSAG